MPEGIQYPDSIDKVVQEKDGSVVLIMREDRPWDGSEQRLVELRRKINTYAAFVQQKQLEKNFPDLAGKPVSFQLMCLQHQPDPKTMQFLDRANAQLAAHSLQIKVRVIQVATPEMRRQELKQGGNPWWKIW
jgi:hypothetical protein